MDCSLPGFTDHGIFQARVLEWVAIAFSRGSSQPRDQTQVSCIVGRRFTLWATREAQEENGAFSSLPFQGSWGFSSALPSSLWPNDFQEWKPPGKSLVLKPFFSWFCPVTTPLLYTYLHFWCPVLEIPLIVIYSSGHCIFFFFFLVTPLEACGILLPWPRIKPAPPALEAWSLNHWTTKEKSKSFCVLKQTSIFKDSIIYLLI